MPLQVDSRTWGQASLGLLSVSLSGLEAVLQIPTGSPACRHLADRHWLCFLRREAWPQPWVKETRAPWWWVMSSSWRMVCEGQVGAGVKPLRGRDKVNFAVPSTGHQSPPGHSSQLPGLLFPALPFLEFRNRASPSWLGPSLAHSPENPSRAALHQRHGALHQRRVRPEEQNSLQCFEWEWFNSTREWAKERDAQFWPKNFCFLFRVRSVSEAKDESGWPSL